MIKLKEINPRIAADFIHLKKFCNYDENYPLDGVALKEKKGSRIFCFAFYDFDRGRSSNPPECCIKNRCPHYYFVDPRQTKLSDFEIRNFS